MRDLVTLFLATALAATIPVAEQERSGGVTAQVQADIPEDLQVLTNSLQKTLNETILSKDGHKLAAELELMRVPAFEIWFGNTFRGDTGRTLAATYPQTAATEESRLAEFFTKIPPGGSLAASIASGGVEPQKSAFLQGFDDAIRKSLTNPAVFYRLQYLLNKEGGGSPIAFLLGYVVAVDGRYRFLGDGILRQLPNMPALRIRQGGKVAAASLLNKVQPIYPIEARQAGVSGTVRLHAIIAKDGSIQQLEVLSGDSLLVPAALEAVRQWRYRPTFLNAEPVEVDTTIDVIFSLGR